MPRVSNFKLKVKKSLGMVHMIFRLQAFCVLYGAFYIMILAHMMQTWHNLVRPYIICELERFFTFSHKQHSKSAVLRDTGMFCNSLFFPQFVRMNQTSFIVFFFFRRSKLLRRKRQRRTTNWTVLSGSHSDHSLKRLEKRSKVVHFLPGKR